MQHAIYQSYLSHCRPFQLLAPWQELRADRCAYLAPASVDDAWQELSANYSETELIDAGLAQLDVEGKLTLHPALAVPEAPLVALTDPKTNNIVNLLAEEGCITGGLPPVLAILADRATREALKGTERKLFLTGDLKDTILLRSLGLAAAPVWGLSKLGEQELIRLGKLFQINVRSPSGHGAANKEQLPTTFQEARRAVDEFHERNQRIGLVLVNWSPSCCSFADVTQIHCAIQFLLQLEEFCGYEIDDVGIWFPQPSRRKALEFFLARSKPAWMKHAVLESLSADIEEIKATNQELPTTRESEVLATVMRLFGDIPEEDLVLRPRRHVREQALGAFRNIIFKHILQPLFAQACAVNDPMERSARFEYARLCVLYDIKLRAMEERPVGDDHRAPDRRDKSTAELLSIARQLATLRKEISQWNTQPKTSALSARRLQTISISHFAASGSMTNN